jgi:hypothetical protein
MESYLDFGCSAKTGKDISHDARHLVFVITDRRKSWEQRNHAKNSLLGLILKLEALATTDQDTTE